MDKKQYVAITDLQANCDAKLGDVPASVRAWKSVVSAQDKEELFLNYFADLKKSTAFGAELAKNYAARSKEIGMKLVEDKVAFNEKDVNTVMLTGFFHAYGPINDY